MRPSRPGGGAVTFPAGPHNGHVSPVLGPRSRRCAPGGWEAEAALEGAAALAAARRGGGASTQRAAPALMGDAAARRWSRDLRAARAAVGT